MKQLILPLIALTFLVGACSSPTETATKPSGPPVITGKRATAWGELPTYDSNGHSFAFARKPLHPQGTLDKKSVALDVMVNADGSVKDATVVESSGDPGFDKTALAAFIGARYSLELGANDPAPYVVRQEIKFNREDRNRYVSSSQPFGDIGRQDSMPPSGAPYYQPVSGAGTGLSGASSSSSSSTGK